MSESLNWIDLGFTEKFISNRVTSIKIDKTTLAIIYKEEKFGIISGVCNHAGGPLGEGKLDGNYVVCPWHYWTLHFQTGKGEPGYEEDRVPSYLWKVENGHLFVELNSATKRSKRPHEPHPLARPKGLLAPFPASMSVLLNGTFVDQSGETYEQKPNRSREIFDTGWT